MTDSVKERLNTRLHEHMDRWARFYTGDDAEDNERIEIFTRHAFSAGFWVGIEVAGGLLTEIVHA